MAIVRKRKSGANSLPQSLSVAIQSVEDHGYILDLGITEASGFLPLEDALLHAPKRQLMSGMLIDVCVVKASKNGRTFTCSLDPAGLSSQCVSHSLGFVFTSRSLNKISSSRKSRTYLPSFQAYLCSPW
jgi:hypothetical protein